MKYFTRCSLFLFVIIAFLSYTAIAQKQNNNWFFGTVAGVNFSSGVAVSQTGGRTTSSLCGQSCMSDENGNLLFYTDGYQVWDKNHKIMNSGALNGNKNSGQNCLIVPNPSDATKFYVFTLKINSGLYYTEVDLKLNGGLGALANVNTFVSSLPSKSSSELACVKQPNGNDFWLITTNEDMNAYTIYSFAVSATGVSSTPVSSNLGAINLGLSANQFFLNNLKVSPSKQIMAIAFGTSTTSNLSDIVALANFNNNTGTCSMVGTINPAQNLKKNTAWGVAFSPDNTKLYVELSISDNSGTLSTENIVQYNLVPFAINAINNSADTISSHITPDKGPYLNCLQLGPDDRIYVAPTNQPYLNCITQPNQSGAACGYVEQFVNLTGNCTFMLPAYSEESSCNYIKIKADVNPICKGQKVQLTGTFTKSLSGIADFQWKVSNGTAPNDTSMSDKLPYIVNVYPTVTTTYKVSALDNTCLSEDSIIIKVLPLPTITSTASKDSICPGESITFTGSGGISYEWTDVLGQTLSTQNPFTTIPKGLVVLIGTDANGCKGNVIAKYNDKTTLKLSAPASIISCPGKTLTLGGNPTSSLGKEPYSYSWSSIPAGFSSTLANPTASPSVNTTYTVTASDRSGCSIAASTAINIQKMLAFAGNDKALCTGSSTILGSTPASSGGAGTIKYTWTAISNSYTSNTANPTVNPIANVSYILSVQDSIGCAAKDTVVITLLPKPKIVTSTTNDFICQGTTTSIKAYGASIYIWKENNVSTATISTDNPYTASPVGTVTYYTIGIDNNNCRDTTSIVIKTRAKPAITVNPAKNPVCYNDTATLTAAGGTTYTWYKDNSNAALTTGAVVKVLVLQPTKLLVKGVDSYGCTNKDSVILNTIAPPAVNAIIIPKQVKKDTICTNETTNLQASGANSYRWYDANNPSKTLSTSNLYSPVVTGTTRFVVRGVESQAGCFNTDTVLVVARPLPNLTISATNDSVCSGIGTKLYASGGKTYDWYKLPNTTTAISQLNSINTNPLYNTTTYQVITRDQYNCTQKANKQVYVKSRPVLIASVSSDSICPNNPVKFSAKGAKTYSWNQLDSTNVFASDSSFIFKPIVSSTFAVTGIGSNGCSSRDTASVFIYPSPSAKTIFGSTYACPGSANFKYYTKDDANGNHIHHWFVKGGSPKYIANADTAIINWGPAGDGYVYMQEVSEKGCQGDTMKLLVAIKEKLTPPAPIGISTICAKDAKKLLYKTPYTNPAATFQWYVDGGNIVSGQNTDSIKLDITQTGVKAVKIWFTEQSSTALANCSGISDTLYVTVYPSPNASGKIIGDTAVCAGDQYKPYYVSGLQGSSYNWYIDNSLLNQHGSSIEQSYGPVGYKTIKVIETTTDGCIGDTIRIKVKIYPLPTIQSIIGPDTICKSSLNNQLYTANSIDGVTFLWTVSSGKLLNGQGNDSAYVQWNETGQHYVAASAINKYGCLGPVNSKQLYFDNAEANINRVSTRFESDTIIELQWESSLRGGKLNTYALYRRIRNNGSFTLLSNVPINYYTDKKVFPKQYSYEYQYRVVNQCGDTIASFLHNTMLLAGNANQTNKSASLHWNAYKNWKYGLMHYEVWRKLDTEQDFKLIQTTGTDTSIVLNNGYDGFKHVYRIKAIENSTSAFSWSNETTLTFEHLINIPTAFSPNGDGVNEYWVIRNIEAYKDASVTIYNRWGKLILEAKPYQNNWDGRLNGEDIPDGTYFYIIKLNRKSANQAPDIMGNVTIIR